MHLISDILYMPWVTGIHVWAIN